MTIVTEVKLKLATPGRADGVRAWAKVVLFDLFAIKDLTVTRDGRLVNMPERHRLDHCPACDRMNVLQARHCQMCGRPLDPERARFCCPGCGADNFAGNPRCAKCNERLTDGRNVLFEEVCHPISRRCRAAIEEAVLKAFRAQLALPKDETAT